MQNRLKQLRVTFGCDRQALAEFLECLPEQFERWESGAEPLPDRMARHIASRTGVSAEWIQGADVPMWGARVTEIREWLAQEVMELTGMKLVEMVTATTGERIAYALHLMHRADPDLFTVECVAGWLGLSVESTELLLAGELDPGTPVVIKASELTGLSEQWFRSGPGMEAND